VEALRKDIRTGAMLRSLRRGLRDRTLVTGRGAAPVVMLGIEGIILAARREDEIVQRRVRFFRRRVYTGHNWQFTASWMGEPPSSIEPEIDASERLRRLYLVGEAPPPHDAG
jgi:hypothetical protein